MPIRGRSISILVHADTKVGKTTLGATAPKPMLLLDAEAAHRFLPHSKVFWDPMYDAPPVPGHGGNGPNGQWDICVVVIRDYSVMVRVMQWLQSGQHHFESVVIDSISEVQKKLKDQVTGGLGDMDQRKWGEMLTHMEALIRQLRDLTEHPTRPLTAIVITAMTEMRDGKWRPYVQGQLRTTLPYFIDVVGYLFVQEVPPSDPSQPAPEPIRRMLTRPHMQFEAGERVQGRLPQYVDGPNVEQILNDVFGPVPDQQPVAVSAQA
jgi:hypothetical protein